MPSSTEKILKTATECFFQYGYNAANISMISRHSAVSRVTIHKHFKSKELLFRAVVDRHFEENSVQINHYINDEDDFWQATENLTIAQCRDLFEDITSTLVRADLIHAGHAYCRDIIQAHEDFIREAIRIRLVKEIKNHRLTLERINLNEDALVDAIHYAPFGIAISVFENEDNQAFIKNLISIFKASTLPL